MMLLAESSGQASRYAGQYPSLLLGVSRIVGLFIDQHSYRGSMHWPSALQRLVHPSEVTHGALFMYSPDVSFGHVFCDPLAYTCATSAHPTKPISAMSTAKSLLYILYILLRANLGDWLYSFCRI